MKMQCWACWSPLSGTEGPYDPGPCSLLIIARIVPQVYNWWLMFLRLALPDKTGLALVCVDVQ